MKSYMWYLCILPNSKFVFYRIFTVNPSKKRVSYFEFQCQQMCKIKTSKDHKQFENEKEQERTNKK